MKALLAYVCDRPESEDPYGSRLPMGFGYLAAAATAAGHGCQLLNASRGGVGRLVGALRSQRPDLVGMTLYSFNRAAVLAAARAARREAPGCRILFGGPHAAPLAAALLATTPDLDFVATGEGEGTFVALLDALQKGGSVADVPGLAWRRDGAATVTPPAPPVTDLDALGSPGRAMLAAGVVSRADHMYLATSRGCTGTCTFCSSPGFWGHGPRWHSVPFVLKEVELRAKEGGAAEVSFRDDCFATDRARTLELCRALAVRAPGVLWDCQCRVEALDAELADALARGGCRTVQLGVEHGSPTMQRLLGKRHDREQVVEATRLLRRAGVEASFYLITAIPGETPQDRKATRALLDAARPHDALVAPLALYPGTPLYALEARRRSLPHDFWLTVRDHWVLALPEREARQVVEEERTYVEALARRNRFTSQELSSAWNRLGQPWPLGVATAQALHAERRVAEAEELLRGLDPGKQRYWRERTLAKLLLETERPREALPHARAAHDLLPRCPGAAALLARALRGSGLTRDAEPFVQLARERDPDEPELHFLGDRERARVPGPGRSQGPGRSPGPRSGRGPARRRR